MQWAVFGTNRTSGSEFFVFVEAECEAQARLKAPAEMLVSSVLSENELSRIKISRSGSSAIELLFWILAALTCLGFLPAIAINNGEAIWDIFVVVSFEIVIALLLRILRKLDKKP